MQFANGIYLGFSEPVSLVEWETGFGVRPAFARPLPNRSDAMCVTTVTTVVAHVISDLYLRHIGRG